MPDPFVDLEKGITGLKEEDDVQCKHPKVKVMCVKVLLHMFPWVFLAATIVEVVSLHRYHDAWYSRLISLIMLLAAISLFWKFRDIKEANIQRMLGSSDSDLSTTLLSASTPVKGSKK